MITAPNTYRQGVVGGFVIEPMAEILPVVFSLAPISPSTALNQTWISVGGAPGGWTPTVGEQMEFVIGDNYSGMPMVTGAAFNFRGGWVASTSYAVGDAFIAYDGSGILRTWLVTTAFTSGSGSIFTPSADVKQMNFRGAYASGTAYTAGDLVLALDTFGIMQTWVALSGFTSSGPFVQGTQWGGCLASQTIYYVVAVGPGMIQISTTPGGTPVSFMSSGFCISPDTAPVLSGYFGVASFGAGGGLTPALTVGALWAQGTAWVPSSAPVVPAAPASQFSYLGYNSSTGLYWTTNPVGNTAGDAILGWVETDASDIIAASMQDIPVESGSGSTSGGGSNSFEGSPGSVPVSAPGTGGNINSLVTMAIAAGAITPDATEAYNIFVLQSNVVLALPANCPVLPQVAQTTVILQQGTGLAVFIGSGLNDATSGGTYSSYVSGDTPHTYLVQISATGSPDQFTWSKDGGAMSSPIAITGGTAQTLGDGITITFAASTGHHLGDQWLVQVGGFSVDISAYGSGLPYELANAQSPAGTECIQVLLCSTGGTRFLYPPQMNVPIL